MSKTIIIGSNGILGKKIVERAIEKIGIENIVLSDYKQKRLLDQSERLAIIHGKKPKTIIIDINSEISIEEGLTDINYAVIALQQREPLIQKICIKKKISSVDLSVNSIFLKKATQLTANSESIQLLTGGLFPGLSGILTKDIYKKNANEIVSVGLLQSKNGTNGKTGVSDMLQILNSDVELINEKQFVKHSGLSEKEMFDFGSDKGRRWLRLSNFIERELLLSQGIKSNYFTAFDMESANIAVLALKKIGVLNLLKYKIANTIICGLISNKKAKNVDESIGLALKTSTREIFLILKSDYEATASCAIAFLNSIKNSNENGILYPFQLFSFSEIKDEISDVIKNYEESA